MTRADRLIFFFCFFINIPNLPKVSRLIISMNIFLKKKQSRIGFLILFSCLLYAGSVLGYTPPSPEELQMARQLRVDTLLKTLSSGGIRGNLGGALLVSFSMLIPTTFSLLFALRFRFYALKAAQYPSLICLAVAVLVFFVQPHFWTTGDWANRYVDFVFMLGSLMGSFSAFLLYRIGSKSALICLVSILLGVPIYLLRL